MDLEVIGHHALLFDDDAMAAFVNSPDALVDWNSLSIDRYDVRHLLSSLPPPRNLRRRLNRRSTSPSSDDGSLESELDYERYLDLPSSSDDEQGLNKEDGENVGGYHAVAFSYGAPDEPSDQKNVDAESSFRPPFPVPENLLQNVPPTAKAHQIIARTAMFVSKHGGQSEIILRVKQGGNPTFGFLLPDHNLHPYFRFLVDHQELLKSDAYRKSTEGNRTDGDLDQMGGESGALSLLGSVYGSGEDEEGATEDTELEKREFKEISCADNITPSHGTEQNNQSSNAAGKDEVLSKPPCPPLKEKPPVIKRTSSIRTVKSGTTTGVRSSGDSMGSVSSAVEKLTPSISSNLPKVEPLVLDPPSDMKRVVDKIVEFILRNGKEFEAVLVQQDTKHGRFPFLLPSNPYHPYYLKALQKAQEDKIAGKKLTSEKHVSTGHRTEKKSGSRESDTATLSSDIPYESDRKEKFKMVIGKSKKDEKEQSSKATRPQVGVVVDAAAAAAILQAARRGIKNPNLEILSKTGINTGQGPSGEGGSCLLSSWPQNSNHKPDQKEGSNVSVPDTKFKAASVAVSAEDDSLGSSLSREQKVKAERLKRAKMFAAMIKCGAAPVKSESLQGSSAEPSESGRSDSQDIHLLVKERESSSAPMEVDTINKIQKTEKVSADEQNERRAKRSYRSRSRRGEGEEEEGEDEEEKEVKEDKDHKHSRKKRRSRHSSHHSRDRHKHRKRHSSRDTESHYLHEHYNPSEEEDRRSRHRHKHYTSSDDEKGHSIHKHRHTSSSDDEQRHSRHKHMHAGSSDDEERHSRHKRRYDSSSDDEHRRSRRQHRHASPHEHRHIRHRHKHKGSSDDEQLHTQSRCRHNSSDDDIEHTQRRHKHGASSDDEDRLQAKSIKHKRISPSERDADLEEGEIVPKSDQSKDSEGDGVSREASVDLSKSSRRSGSGEVSDDLRAKIRAMLMATL